MSGVLSFFLIFFENCFGEPEANEYPILNDMIKPLIRIAGCNLIPENGIYAVQCGLSGLIIEL